MRQVPSSGTLVTSSRAPAPDANKAREMADRTDSNGRVRKTLIIIQASLRYWFAILIRVHGTFQVHSVTQKAARGPRLQDGSGPIPQNSRQEPRPLLQSSHQSDRID